MALKHQENLGISDLAVHLFFLLTLLCFDGILLYIFLSLYDNSLSFSFKTAL
jgi:hypothetical protein